ncbi:MAG: manganese efflux pump MntP family protein [Candidatus Krumholzibacteriia bacterium]
MPDLSTLLVAVALSMDACAVAVGARASGRASGGRALFRLSFHFGLFQALMPLIGWLMGRLVAERVAAVDHWVAFAILGLIGGRMIRSGRAADDHRPTHDPSRGATLVMLSVATSIDALAVGFGLAMLGVEIWLPAVTIGVVTAVLVVVASRLGDRLSERFGPRAEIVGGVILILVGLRILVGSLLG